MALNAALLGAQIKSAVDAVADKTNREDLFEAMAQAIVLHIQTNAVVAVTVISVSGVTTGPGISGPGLGTGTIS